MSSRNLIKTTMISTIVIAATTLLLLFAGCRPFHHHLSKWQNKLTDHSGQHNAQYSAQSVGNNNWIGDNSSIDNTVVGPTTINNTTINNTTIVAPPPVVEPEIKWLHPPKQAPKDPPAPTDTTPAAPQGRIVEIYDAQPAAEVRSGALIELNMDVMTGGGCGYGNVWQSRQCFRPNYFARPIIIVQRPCPPRGWHH